MDTSTNLENTPNTNQPQSAYKEGQTIYHQASHNRFQEYKIKKIEWDPKAMMGAGCYIYTVDFLEWDNSGRTSLGQDKYDWRVAEVNLPIHNLIPWEPRKVL